MANANELAPQDMSGEFTSPGGFVFGVQGWTWGDQRPTAVTFFLDGTAMVCDQHGRPIKGVQTNDGNVVLFASSAPADISRNKKVAPRPQFASHAKVIAALAGERIDVINEMNLAGTPCPMCKGTKQKDGRVCRACFYPPAHESTGLRQGLQVTGWPQLPYAELKKIKNLSPDFPKDELKKIPNAEMRRDALKMHDELMAAKKEEEGEE